jgi:hypothetical protein
MFVWMCDQLGGVHKMAVRQDGFRSVEVEIVLIQATLNAINKT